MSARRDKILNGVTNEVAHNDWTFYMADAGAVDDGAIVDLVMHHVDGLLAELEGRETWLVNYGGYIHGVFSSEEGAKAYTDRRWAAFSGPPSNWKIEQWTVDKGAFDPLDEENDDE